MVAHIFEYKADCQHFFNLGFSLSPITKATCKLSAKRSRLALGLSLTRPVYQLYGFHKPISHELQRPLSSASTFTDAAASRPSRWPRLIRSICSHLWKRRPSKSVRPIYAPSRLANTILLVRSSPIVSHTLHGFGVKRCSACLEARDYHGHPFQHGARFSLVPNVLIYWKRRSPPRSGLRTSPTAHCLGST